MNLTVADLNPEKHEGLRAVVGGWEGRLTWSTALAPHRVNGRCWYLVVPSRLKHSGQGAISLQWATYTRVVLLDDEEVPA